MKASEIHQRLRHQVLEANMADQPWWRRSLVFLARLVLAVGRDVVNGHLTLRAMGLVYTSLLSFVPLLAVSFSVLKGFGVHNQIEPALAGFLAPLGDQAQTITDQIVGFVDNLKVGVLGALGLAMLIYTVISLMQKIEEAFNEVWRVKAQRTVARRFSDYLSVLLTGPLLVFAALGITASVFSSEFVRSLSAVEPLGYLVDLAAALVPYVLIIAAFTFVYLFIPNTRVRLLSALVGAIVAGVGWQTTGWAFASFIATSTRYTAIYSAFATLILFMLWLYFAWLILLVGASVAYYYQHPRRLLIFHDDSTLSPRMAERIALSIVALVAQAYYAREPALSANLLARRLHLPVDSVAKVLEALTKGGLLRTLEPHKGAIGHTPATPPEETTVAEVLRAVRRHGEEPALRPESVTSPDGVQRFLRELDDTLSERFGQRTIRDLVRAGSAESPRADEDKHLGVAQASRGS